MDYRQYRYRDDHFAIKKAPTNVDLGLSTDELKKRVRECTKQLSDLQKILYAKRTYGVIIVLQAMDAAGKDSMIAHVFSGVNPVGVKVANFKQPNSTEILHDYLWRINQQLPERGQIGIFNRSYYEDVLIARVHPEILVSEHLPNIEKVKDIKESFYADRYQDLRDYEAYLTRNGFKILKFFLHVSKEEQGARFAARIEIPDKNWKFSAADIRERQYWDAYQDAYEKAIQATATKDSPWYVIPSDDKWSSRYIVANALVDQISHLPLAYPLVTKDKKKELKDALKELKKE